MIFSRKEFIILYIYSFVLFFVHFYLDFHLSLIVFILVVIGTVVAAQAQILSVPLELRVRDSVSILVYLDLFVFLKKELGALIFGMGLVR